MCLSEKYILVLSLRNSPQVVLGMLRSISELGLAPKATPLVIGSVIAFVNENSDYLATGWNLATNEALTGDLPVKPAVVSNDLVTVAETFSSVIREIEALIQAGNQLIIGLTGQIPVVDYALITAAHRYAPVRYAFSFHMSDEYVASSSGGETANSVPARTNRSLLRIPTYESYEYRGNFISNRNKIFFCYSGNDAKMIREEFLCHFTTLQTDNIVIDRNHASNIEVAIRETRVVVLFITPDFLQDKYIQEFIKPLVMRDVQNERILLLWLVMAPVVGRHIEEFTDYEPLNDPERPFNILSKPKRRIEATKISEAIQNAYYSLD